MTTATEQSEHTTADIGNFGDAPPADGVLRDHAPELGETFEPPPAFTGVSFASRVHNLILTMKAAGMSFPELEDHQNGIKRKISPGFRLEFKGGYLSIDEGLRKAWRDFLLRYGKHYFVEQADIEDLLEESLEDLIREHPTFGSANPDGFTEIEAAIPPATGELEAILNAALAGDEAAIEAIYDREVAGFKREQVLEAAKRALEAIYEQKVGATAHEEGSERPAQRGEEPPAPEDPREAELAALRARVAELEDEQAQEPPAGTAEALVQEIRDEEQA